MTGWGLRPPLSPVLPSERMHPVIRVIGFERRYRPDGRAEDWVEYTAKTAITETGALSYSTRERVKLLKPIDGDENGLRAAYRANVWSQIGPAYEAWCAGNEIPETGTPLGAYPGISAAQADVLRSVGIRTVEELRDYPIGSVARVPLPEFRAIQKMAGDWLLARPAAEQAGKIAELEAQLAAALEMLSERTEEEPKRGPGRPRKTEAA